MTSPVVVRPGEPGWPTALSGPGAPEALWCDPAGFPDAECVAVSGSRDAPGAALEWAASVAAGVAAAGVTVVAGLAVGVDAAAHQAAMAVSGRTVGVLGCGVDVVYPRATGRLRRDMVAAGGAVVSGFLPGTPVDRWRLAARNRIIAGASRAVVVAPTSARSGSRHAVAEALRRGRRVVLHPQCVDDAGWAADAVGRPGGVFVADPPPRRR